MPDPEKISRRERNRYYRKYLKRVMSRLRRRKGKLDPENAPRKTRHLTRGWSD